MIRTLRAQALLLLAGMLGASVSTARPLKIGPRELPALRNAIFIQGNGEAADLVDSSGHAIDFAALYRGNTARRPSQLQRDLEGKQKILGGPDSIVVAGPNYDYSEYLRGLFAGFEESRKKRILLWIHGARNPIGNSPKRTLALVSSLDSTDFYPICINWQSSDLTSYTTHLTYARPAKRNFLEKGWRVLKPPLILVHDLGQGVARLPLSIYGDISRIGTSFVSDRKALTTTVDNLTYSRGALKGGNRYVSAGWSLVTLPVRSVFMLFINAGGPGEWESFQHSTHEMFRTDQDLISTKAVPEIKRPSGALAAFMDSLSEHVPANSGIKITLVGHSMGSMVSCEMLRYKPKLPVDNIVFMAAACKVHDLFDTIVPFMEQPAHDSTAFSNLMLHRCNDLDETFVPYLGDLIYRGSLLTWIDDFLENTESPIERTLGRDENAVPATRFVPKEVRNRISFRTFGRNDALELAQLGSSKRVPQHHGDFSLPRTRFWQVDFQKPAGAVSDATPGRN